MLLIQNRSEEKRTLQEKDKAKRLKYHNEYIKNKRSKETGDQYQSRLGDLRMRAHIRYARETDEQCEARLQDLRMRVQNRCASETDA